MSTIIRGGVEAKLGSRLSVSGLRHEAREVEYGGNLGEGGISEGRQWSGIMHSWGSWWRTITGGVAAGGGRERHGHRGWPRLWIHTSRTREEEAISAEAHLDSGSIVGPGEGRQEAPRANVAARW
jgi:hypothetical protein